MRPLRGAAIVLLSAGATLVTDIAIQSSIIQTLWPVILSPADGAVLTAPVTVRWEGPRSLHAVVVGGGAREDLGQRDNPFVIDDSRLHGPGTYTLELHTFLGTVRRRFELRTPAQVAETRSPPPDEGTELREKLARLQTALDRSQAESTGLYEENAELRRQNADLGERLDELSEQLEQCDSRAEMIEARCAELERRVAETAEENRTLRVRLESIPPCTLWGYLSFPRPQRVPRVRRVVLASNDRGEVFETQIQCEVTRRADPTAASPCVCLSGNS